MNLRVIADSYFDGLELHSDGPWTFRLEDGRVRSIERGESADTGDRVQRAAFVMPGLVEAHAHLFLEGGELGFKARSAHLKADRTTHLATARRNLERSVRHGITHVRDAGDKHGINHAIRGENRGPRVHSAGRAIRPRGGYGSFMAAEAEGLEEVEQVATELCQTADALKILLTDIIDFEKGQMKGGVQFSPEETKRLVEVAEGHGLPTFAHCSGPEGLAIATEAGIGSIEHGFFMEKRFLEVMAEKQIQWVPTFSPVELQWRRPELGKWNEETVSRLRAILDNHFEHVGMAQELGVPLAAGSDAGSYGVEHGVALIDELRFMREAGLTVAQVLASATSTPRRLWAGGAERLAEGAEADLVALAESPFDRFEALADTLLVVVRERVLHCTPEERRDRRTPVGAQA